MVAETREYLQPTVNEFERPSDRMELRVNVGKNKVIVIKKDQRRSCERVKVNGEEMQRWTSLII